MIKFDERALLLMDISKKERDEMMRLFGKYNKALLELEHMVRLRIR